MLAAKKSLLALAKKLDAAQRERRTIDQLTLAEPKLDESAAYLVQDELLALRVKRGERVIGYKMGLTSKVKMIQMGVHSPIYGKLTDKMQVPSDGSFDPAKALHPRVEPEIAFLIGKDLKGPVSAQEALSACSGVCAAMEILDSRYKNFKFTLADVIADNCSSCAFVLGPWKPLPSEAALGELAIILAVNGAPAAKGKSSAIYGNPLYSLMELANMLSTRGLAIPKNSIVLSGAATEAFTLRPGSTVEVIAQSLGSAAVSVLNSPKDKTS